MEEEKSIPMWIKVMIGVVVFAIATISTGITIGLVRGDRNLEHSTTDFLVQNNTKEIGVNKKDITDIKEDHKDDMALVNKRVDATEKTQAGIIASQQSLLAGQARQEASQVRQETKTDKQTEKIQEVAETVAGLKVYLESFTVEGED